ncbi:aminotransferase class I/II-fold pyridoxal phosphate-dependent enzyme [Streptomyces sp. NPDC048142]|uniref:aminotransferase class I/II-fold pyridoxal phosphate-dependent enzyme n=1 Tax=Streptomyces sp. NPDC048142 TaxID=3365501 RepID=UPI0037101E9D
MRGELARAGIDFIAAPSHLVPVTVPGGERVKQASQRLLDEFGIYVQPVNYPSVAKASERFRITVQPFRTPEQIEGFAEALHTCLASA